jgi:hypothetical protein
MASFSRFLAALVPTTLSPTDLPFPSPEGIEFQLSPPSSPSLATSTHYTGGATLFPSPPSSPTGSMKALPRVKAKGTRVEVPSTSGKFNVVRSFEMRRRGEADDSAFFFTRLQTFSGRRGKLPQRPLRGEFEQEREERASKLGRCWTRGRRPGERGDGAGGRWRGRKGWRRSIR